jgi:hypothetical protein
MKFLNKYSKFFESSQSKKIRQYIGYSVVLEWYKENKEKIAKLLDVNASELADEDTLMKQSYDLVNSVINTQTSGNTGIPGTDIPGFEEFKKIENNLIHDILHNLFNVKYKEFNKSLSDIQFTESEIIEEIECLAIEESFMKYMNINYPKTDFINANINQLASYLMMSILKNDPERIQKILDGEEQPYLEVYGKKYPVKGTAFEYFFDLFKNKDADRSFKIKNADDLKDYMIDLINIGKGIGDTSGDRANYPNSEYYGLMSWYDSPSKNKINWIKNNFEDLSRNDFSDSVTEWILLDNSDYKIKKWKFDYVIIGSGENVFKYEPNDKEERKIYLELLSILTKLGFDENTIKNTKSSMLQVFLNDIKWQTREIKVEYLNKETNKKYRGYINIDNIPNYLTSQLKLESLDFREEKFKNREELEAIPIRPRFIDMEKAFVKDFDTWFEYLENLVGENIIWETDDYKCIGIKKIEEEIENEEGDYETKFKYEIMSSEEFEDANRDYYNENSNEYYPDDYKFIDYDVYEEMSFREVTKKLFLDDDSVSIMRRNFRLGDIIKNNTNLGNIDKYDTGDDNLTKKIKTKNPKHTYIDFHGENDPEKSISKAILTDNGKKLKELLDNFRGYVITNFKRIKEDFKKNKAKFAPHIETFKKLNINELNIINNFDFTSSLEINLSIIYRYDKSIQPVFDETSNKHGILCNFYKDFDKIKELTKLIDNIEDINYLKNFVNISGNVKTTKDYFDLKKIITSISKKNIFKWKSPIIEIYSDPYKTLNDDLINIIKDSYKENIIISNIKPTIDKIIKQVYPNIRTKNIEVLDFSDYKLKFRITIDI